MKLPKIIAFYFPQFHPIHENNVWWGDGFTDWQLVKDSKPLFDNHIQPRIPYSNNYYNPCDVDTLLSQSILAKKYGIGGFMFYHYWFDGKLMLEKPLEVFLANKNIDIPFCLSWANESWTRSWIGRPDIVLQKQNHTEDVSIWEKHFYYLLPFFIDSRYIRINDMPIFLIYQPHLVKKSAQMFDFWNSLAKKNNLKGIYFIAIKNHSFVNNSFLSSYSGIMKFQPREAYSSKDFSSSNIKARLTIFRIFPEKIVSFMLKIFTFLNGYKVYDSSKIWDIIHKYSYEKVENFPKLDIYESTFHEWDNTPRYKRKAKIFLGTDLKIFKSNLSKLYKNAIDNNSEYIFYNAWNEWSESAYLEPDNIYGFKKLEIIKEIIEENSVKEL